MSESISTGEEATEEEGNTKSGIDDKLLREIRDRFTIPNRWVKQTAELEAAVANLNATVKPIGMAFLSNIRRVESTLSMPFTFAYSAISQQLYQSISAKERIRSLLINVAVPPNDLDETRRIAALDATQEKMKEYVESENGRYAIVNQTAKFLVRSLEDFESIESSQSLIDQSIISLWSAHEVLLRDYIETMLNNDSAMAVAFMSDSRHRKRFNLDRVGYDTLIECGLNLSDKIGSLAISQGGTLDFPSIRTVFDTIHPENSELRDALSQKDIWLLYQLRHLMAHRGGIIDSDFIKNTGLELKLGDRYSLTAWKMGRLHQSVISVGIKLFKVE